MGFKGFTIESYHLSHRTGCMLEEPLHALPAYFEPWNRLAKAVGDLYTERRLREEVHQLPLLDHTKLQGYRQLRLAHVQLSYITSGYVWQNGDEGVATVLPKCVAIPFHTISKQLGIPPIVCYSDLALSNYLITDTYSGNIDCLISLPGGEAAKPFATVAILVEMEFAKCLKPMEKILNLLHEYPSAKERVQDIADVLEYLAECIKDMKKACALIQDHLPVSTFFNIVRPFLRGWHGEEHILPDGLIYEGVSDEPVKLKGGSGAQSTSMQALDAFLGISHSGEMRDVLVSVRNFMPPDHVRFIDDLEKYSRVSSYVEEMDVPALTKAYNNCINAALNFRSLHIGIILKYIISAAKNADDGKSHTLDDKGTGGTDIMPFLKGVMRNTRKKRIGINQDEKDTVTSRGSIRVFLGLAVSGLCVAFALSKLVN